ncbi:hypothetical protein PsAD2_04092 [Pseudovibrio axinellae]|uniref:Uncharacterized protein n=1 Tax=Pseudovibrio axinellae TaxID=989403 RepID=A0A165U0Y8_9HYPH|nr:hypothetical protein PsAD2_04092 [Pseudovibrio axinellae]
MVTPSSLITVVITSSFTPLPSVSTVRVRSLPLPLTVSTVFDCSEPSAALTLTVVVREPSGAITVVVVCVLSVTPSPLLSSWRVDDRPSSLIVETVRFHRVPSSPLIVVVLVVDPLAFRACCVSEILSKVPSPSRSLCVVPSRPLALDTVRLWL